MFEITKLLTASRSTSLKLGEADGDSPPVATLGIVEGTVEEPTGSHPQGAAKGGMNGQKLSCMKPSCPASWKAPQLTGSVPSILTMMFGRVISRPSPHMLQGGKPGLGGTGAVAILDGLNDGA